MYAPNVFDDRLMDNFFDGFFNSPAWTPGKTGTMRTDISEKDGNYHMEIEMPGYKKENIRAELKNGYLTVTGSQDEAADEKDDKGNVIFTERHTGECRRSYYVGEHLNEEDITASFEDGVLKLDFPSEEKKPLVEEKKLIAIR